MNKKPNSLIGIWKLVYYRINDGRDSSAADVLGQEPHGFISYWPNGYMQVVIGGKTAIHLRGDWSKIDDSLKARCLDRLICYGGKYEIFDDCVHHHIEVSYIPNWEIKTQIRRMEFLSENELLLTTINQSDANQGSFYSLLWHRIDNQDISDL